MKLNKNLLFAFTSLVPLVIKVPEARSSSGDEMLKRRVERIVCLAEENERLFDLSYSQKLELRSQADEILTLRQGRDQLLEQLQSLQKRVTGIEVEVGADPAELMVLNLEAHVAQLSRLLEGQVADFNKLRTELESAVAENATLKTDLRNVADHGLNYRSYDGKLAEQGHGNASVESQVAVDREELEKLRAENTAMREKLGKQPEHLSAEEKIAHYQAQIDMLQKLSKTHETHLDVTIENIESDVRLEKELLLKLGLSSNDADREDLIALLKTAVTQYRGSHPIMVSSPLARGAELSASSIHSYYDTSGSASDEGLATPVRGDSFAAGQALQDSWVMEHDDPFYELDNRLRILEIMQARGVKDELVTEVLFTWDPAWDESDYSSLFGKFIKEFSDPLILTELYAGILDMLKKFS